MSSPMEIDSQGFDDSFAKDFDQRVLQEIDKARQRPNPPKLFASSTVLSLTDTLKLLEILITVRLGKCPVDCPYFFAKDLTDLASRLCTAYVTKSFAHLINDDGMPPEFTRGPMTPSNSGNLKAAFEAGYMGGIHQRFIETLNRERMSYSQPAAKRPYNWSISVIQSSGTGKSRMAQEAANTIFTIPMNLREDLGPSYTISFPPPDPLVLKYFKDRESCSDRQQQTEFALLLEALFDTAAGMVRRFWPGRNGPYLARRWADYLNEGQTENSSGTNRESFFALAISKAEEEAAKLLSKNALKLQDAPKPVERKYKGFKDLLKRFKTTQKLTPTVNTEPITFDRSEYHNLGTTMAMLVDCQVFFIFMSTNSHMRGFAPRPSDCPSARVSHGSQLIPPFNELPFDLHREELLLKLGPPTLENMSKTETIVASGRPLWYSNHKACPKKNIYVLAVDKLSGEGLAKRRKDAEIAALAVLIGIAFDGIHAAALDIQYRLVSSHMRMVYSIPRHRAYMHTGYPSEPVLAEASGRLFEGDNVRQFSRIAPDILAMICNDAFIARGERGELVGRLILICSVWESLDRLFKSTHSLPDDLQPRYHHPIPLANFIRALFNQTHWEKILGAKPITNKIGSLTLDEAFSGSYVFFSHFALARDSKMLCGIGLASALARGMALQAKECQESIDAVIPIHMGTLKTPISPKTTSAINLQFKNRKQA
ncbi:G2/mitotic-specific cyclin cdc13 [Ceratobasidium sp. AG-Ba]|nr:G2/mitotic-specific cyclin cdc13 [Ceratobasidium sp. AG-Ba]